MRPYDAKGERILGLRRSHKDNGDFWILTDGYSVSLAEQKEGEGPQQGIKIPRAAFNRLIQWYMKDQER